MDSVEVISNSEAAAAALDPVRNRLLHELATPGSASTLARTIGISRQKINYYLRSLEQHGLIRQAETRKWGGITERTMVASANSYVISPAALGPVAVDPEQEKDTLSASYMIALAARVVREVAELVKIARKKEKSLATLSLDAKIRFASPADRASFSRELSEAVMMLVSKYHDDAAPEGREHRLVVAAHPILKESNKV